MSSASDRVHSNIYPMVTKEVGIKGGPRSASNLENTVMQGEDVHLAVASNFPLPRFLSPLRGSKLTI